MEWHKRRLVKLVSVQQVFQQLKFGKQQRELMPLAVGLVESQAHWKDRTM